LARKHLAKKNPTEKTTHIQGFYYSTEKHY